MKKIKLVVLATLLFAAGNLFGQSKKDAVLKDWERAKAYTKEYLDAMPESGYALKPTPEMRSFAQQMLHLADANYLFGSTAAAEKSPVGELEKSTDQSKANVTRLVLASYDYVTESIKKLTAAQSTETVKLFNTFEMTKESAIHKCFEHQTHHRGQTTVYIRLAGAKPPQEKLF